ncbi:MAG TPA: DUF559 domain-containing protein [Usitatibacter sp.]|jgi:hypothetical protein|nr:DUF559 domain-containing protein [Usitatibacter sp.]
MDAKKGSATERDVRVQLQGTFVPIPSGNLRRSDGRPNFDHIRRIYAAMAPQLLSDRWVDPYFADWPTILTPIELQMWSLIRSQPVPFYPQYPVGGYFIDFANPREKIGIECDSRAWHEWRADLDGFLVIGTDG